MRGDRQAVEAGCGGGRSEPGPWSPQGASSQGQGHRSRWPKGPHAAAPVVHEIGHLGIPDAANARTGLQGSYCSSHAMTPAPDLHTNQNACILHAARVE